jgi:hypothetical protein
MRAVENVVTVNLHDVGFSCRESAPRENNPTFELANAINNFDANCRVCRVLSEYRASGESVMVADSDDAEHQFVMVLRIVRKKIAAGRQQGSDEHGSVHQWAAGRLHSTIGICEGKASRLQVERVRRRKKADISRVIPSGS